MLNETPSSKIDWTRDDVVLVSDYAAAVGEAVPADEFGLSRLVARMRREWRGALECPCCGGTGLSGEIGYDADGEAGDLCEEGCEECDATGVRCGSDQRWAVLPDGSEVALSLEVAS